MEYRDEVLTGRQFLLDGSIFTGCTFHHCQLVFRGTAPFHASACRFEEEVEWVLDGSAPLTIEFLATLFDKSNKGSRDFADRLLQQIRRGRPEG